MHHIHSNQNWHMRIKLFVSMFVEYEYFFTHLLGLPEDQTYDHAVPINSMHVIIQLQVIVM